MHKYDSVHRLVCETCERPVKLGEPCVFCKPMHDARAVDARIAALEAKITNLIGYARHRTSCACYSCERHGDFGPCSCGFNNVIEEK